MTIHTAGFWTAVGAALAATLILTLAAPHSVWAQAPVPPCSPITACPDLMVSEQRSPDSTPVVSGKTLTVTVVVNNAGNAPARVAAQTVLIRDILPENKMAPSELRQQRYTAPPGYRCTAPPPPAPTVDCASTRNDTIAAGQSRTFTFVLIWGAPSLVEVPVVRNTVTVDPANAIAERNESNNSAEKVIKLLVPALRLEQKCEPMVRENVGRPPTLPSGTFWACQIILNNMAAYATAAATIPTGATLRVSFQGLDMRVFWQGTGLTCSGGPTGNPSGSPSWNCSSIQSLRLPIGGKAVLAEFIGVVVGEPPTGIFLSEAELTPHISSLYVKRDHAGDESGYFEYHPLRVIVGGYVDF